LKTKQKSAFWIAQNRVYHKMTENFPSPLGRPLCKRKRNLIDATFENDNNPKRETIAHLANILQLSEKRVQIEFARLRAKNKKDHYRKAIKVINVSKTSFETFDFNLKKSFNPF